MRRPDLIALALLLLVAAFAPLLIYPAFLTKLLCFAIFAMAFNLLVGYVGLLSFGHAMFFGGAAYITGHALKVWGLSTELAILTGVASAAVMGLIIGLIVIKRQGIYFAMITLALSQMFFYFCVGQQDLFICSRDKKQWIYNNSFGHDRWLQECASE